MKSGKQILEEIMKEVAIKPVYRFIEISPNHDATHYWQSGDILFSLRSTERALKKSIKNERDVEELSSQVGFDKNKIDELIGQEERIMVGTYSHTMRGFEDILKNTNYLVNIKLMPTEYVDDFLKKSDEDFAKRLNPAVRYSIETPVIKFSFPTWSAVTGNGTAIIEERPIDHSNDKLKKYDSKKTSLDDGNPETLFKTALKISRSLKKHSSEIKEFNDYLLNLKITS